MENYEEKYKKALEQAKQAIENIPDKSLISWLENVFPELHENEDERDERVRKELIAFLERKQLIPTETKNEWIAWLEKQGEHSNFRNKIQIGDKVTRNEDGVLVNLSQLNRVAKKDEKQGETENFIDKNLVKEEAHRIAWEYSKHYDPLLSKESWCEMAALDMAYWLEKQGKQILTWSEEDELMIQDAIHWINEFQKSNRCKDENDMQNSVTCENWLKSLKPNHWKPSEEQMEALEPLNK